MRYVRQLLIVMLGNLLLAFSISALVLENHFVAGGVSGIGVVLHAYLGVSVSLSVAIINILLFVIGLIFIGREFALTTLISSILFPIFLSFFENSPVFHGLLQDPLLISLIAGCLTGVGLGIIIKSGASTGGVDIIAILMNKKFKVPVSITLYATDLIILLGQVALNDMNHIIYGIIIIIITSLTLNKTLTMGTGLIQLTIMSDSYNQIRNMILVDQNAGVTLLDSEKGYTRSDSQILLSIIPYRKLPEMKRQILQIDPLAFIIVSHVDEVSGKGFTLERNYVG